MRIPVISLEQAQEQAGHKWPGKLKCLQQREMINRYFPSI
jgi:hypothetical protein